MLTLLIIAIASNERNRGYRISSFTMESNTSSSSSPGKGDCNILLILDKYQNNI